MIDPYYHIEDQPIGKLEDAGELVKGGRIDRHWKEITIDPKTYLGEEQIYDNPFLHDTSDALELFNLKSIEFCNWMSQQDRANFLYASMLSLAHLSLLLVRLFEASQPFEAPSTRATAVIFSPFLMLCSLQ